MEVASKSSENGHAILKLGFIRQLALQNGEVEQVLASQPKVFHEESKQHQPSISSILRKFERRPLPTELPGPAVFANVPSSQLIAFGKALTKWRQQNLGHGEQEEKHKSDHGKKTKAAVEPKSLFKVDTASQLNLINMALAATNAFQARSAISPIGMLNLERLEMTPAGIEMGELLATVPLAPREKTSVVQQEWSVVSQEFTSIVTDSLENFSKTGVTENSELAQATNSQNTHSNQFNVTASASGGCGFVSGSASTSFGSQGSESQSANDSRKHTSTVTKEASSRVTQSRKVTISTSSTSGAAETTTRTMENPSDTKVMRVDYFSMMRKWHVGLYRYGLRLTYDLTVPEPGAAMRVVFKQLAELKATAQQTFVFNLSYDDITEDNYPDKAREYSAQLPATAAPIPKSSAQIIGGQIQNKGVDNSGDIYVNQLAFTIPEGYEIDKITLDLELSNAGAERRFDIVGCKTDTWLHGSPIQNTHFDLTGLNGLPFLQGLRGAGTISTMSGGFGNGIAVYTIYQIRSKDYFENWRASI